MPEFPQYRSAESVPARRPSWWPRLFLLGAVVAAIVAYYATGLNKQLTWQALLRWFNEYRSRAAENLWISVPAFFAVYVVVAALSLPIAAWLSILAGALFGRWLGLVVVILAANAGATLAFLSSRYLFRDLVQRKFGDRLAAINAGIQREGAYYLLTLRLIPVVPFWLINLGMGLTPMPVRTFVVISMIGMLPGTFLYVNAGTELANINSLRDVLSLPVIVSLALLGVLPLLLPLLLRKLLSALRKPAVPGETTLPHS